MMHGRCLGQSSSANPLSHYPDLLLGTGCFGVLISSVDFFERPWEPTSERFEASTPNVADAVGLAAAMDFLDALGRDIINAHDRELAAYASKLLSKIPGIRILGPRPGQPRTGLVSISLKEAHARDVVTFADQDGLALRGCHHCNQPLMKKLELTSISRASFYIYNTQEDVD